MITRQLFVKIAMLLSCGMAFAANGTAYYNLAESKITSLAGPGGTAKVTGYQLYLHQDKTGCELTKVYGEGTCIGSVKDTPQNLYNLLQSKWVEHKVNAGESKPSLTFSTDIDLGEFTTKTAAGSCDVNHVALPVLDGVSIDGNGKAVRNLCFVSNEPMTNAMGLFEKIDATNILNLKLEKVRMAVGGSNDGADYYPMGAVAGISNLSTIETITLNDVDIQGPIAGAVVGLLKTSTLKTFNNHNKISVSNNVAITTGYAGSKVFEQVSAHSAFLGGLVGVILRSENPGDASLSNVSASVTVKDLAEGHNSAVGGIAGLYSTVGESISDVAIGKKITAGFCNMWGCTETSVSDVKESSSISGGSSMGGLFGAMAAYRENNSPVPGNFSMSNVYFNGDISSAKVSAANDNERIIALGGLVGYDSLMAGMSVVVDKGSVNANISDSLTAAGNYYYYAGGIMGYGGEGACRNGSGNPDDALSITNVTTSGSITAKASAKDVAGLHVQSFVGGIVGAACLSEMEGGFAGNTASMNIAMNMKTAADNNLVSNGSVVYDTLMVGGIAGFVNTAISTLPLEIVKDNFTGSISVEDSLNTTIIGGIVGGMLQRGASFQGNGHLISFSSVKVENDKVIDYKTNSTAKPFSPMLVSSVGGVCGFCSQFQSMDLIGVKGSINVSGDFAGDTLIVGGLAGGLYASDAIYSRVTRTFVNGDILVDANAAHKKVGFIMGSATFGVGCTLTSNYHYGENDASVTKPAGELYKGGDVSEGWKTSVNVSYTVRNGDAEDLDPVQFNGTKLAAEMKTDNFTKFLKEPYTALANQGWVRLDVTNNGLPYVEGEATGCAVGSFTVNFFDKDLSLAYSACSRSDGTVAAYDTLAIEPTDSTHCSGWQTIVGKDTAVFDFTTQITADLNLYAKYSPNKYKVVFKRTAGENGEIVSGPMSVAYGTKVPFPALKNVDMDSTGYNFVGWNDSTSLEFVTKDLEIVAVYEVMVDIYTYLNEDGSFYDADTVKRGEARRDIAVPEKVDPNGIYEYKSTGWTSAESDEYAGNVFKPTYEASKKVYTITFMHENGDVIKTDSLHKDDSISYPTAPEMDGKKFLKWSPAPTVVSGNAEITAIYTDAEGSSSEALDTVIVQKVEFEKSGLSAVKVSFGADNLDPEAVSKITVSIVDGDSVVADSTFEYTGKESVTDEWSLILNRVGDYKVNVTVVSGSKEKKTVAADDKLVISPMLRTVKNSWKMISVAAIKSNMDEVLKNNFFFYWDESNPIGDYWQYRAYKGGDVDSTRGYWFGSPNGDSLVFDISYSGESGKISWALDSAYSGWNLVANPYGWDISLENGKTNDGSKVTFWSKKPNGSGYDPTTKIGAYEAVWAHVEVKKSNSIVWEVEAKPYFEKVSSEKMTTVEKIAALRKSALRKASSKNWSLLVTLNDEQGMDDSWNVIGAGATAETLAEPPTSMGDYVRLFVNENKTALAKSVKTVADEYEWTLNVNASGNRAGKLSFEGLEELQNAGLHLYVTVDGVTSEVKPGESVKVALSRSSKQVGVRVASAPKAVAVASQISGFHAVKVADGLQMQFETTGDLAGAASRYALVDVKGKVVASGNFSASAGSNSVNLAAPKAGVYFVQLKVGSQMSSAKVLVK